MIPASLNVMMMGGKQTDQYYANVSTLLHFDGANGATSFIDNAPTPKTFTANGNAQISTASPLQDVGSLLLDGTGDFLTTGLSSDFDFGTDDFTIECMVRSTTTAVQTVFYYGLGSSGASSTQAFMLFHIPSSAIQFSLISGSTAYSVASTTVPTINTTYQIGVKRQSGTLSLWVNGVQEHSISANVAINTPTSRILRVGRFVDSTVRDFNGKIDELRITKGVARDLSIYPNSIFPNEA